MTIHSGARDYYTGDLEKRFNYYWDCSLDDVTNPWAEFIRLTDLNPGVPNVRLHFTSGRAELTKPMSKQAYYRWLRSLQVARKNGKIPAMKEQA